MFWSMKGYDVLVNVTNICDARCVMCNIWKNQDLGRKSYLSPALLESVKPLSSVSFAGGEPFLHREIVDMARVVHRNNPRAKIVFSSNGFRTDVIVEKVADILKFHKHVQVTISLDGIGAAHDRMRGVPGAWDKVHRTFQRLGEIGLKRRNFGFTITAENYAMLPEVYAHARKLGAGLSPAVAQSSKFLNVEVPPLRPETILPYLEPLVRDQLKSWNPLAWARAFFLYGVLHYLNTGRRLLLCDAFERQFMIDQTGEILSCHPILKSAGNLNDQPLPAILAKPETVRLARDLRSCHACWELCTARSSIRASLWKVARWAAWNKALVHLGRWSAARPSPLFPGTAPIPPPAGHLKD